jgi:peroxiredoxin
MIESDGHLKESVQEIQAYRADDGDGPWIGGLRRAGATFKALRITSLALVGAATAIFSTTGAPAARDNPTFQKPEAIFDRVRQHGFNPLRDGFTFDRHLDKHGVASLDDQDWLVRTLAVRDLVRLGVPGHSALIPALGDSDPHVRHVAVMVLGILQATDSATALEKVLTEDVDSVVRSQAAIALGQIGRSTSLPVLKSSEQNDKSRDVQHQAALAAYAIEQGIRPTPELATAYAELDETRFNRVKVGQPAPDFQLPDTEGKKWRLSDFRGKQPVVLIWVFADWCPVCHGEFRELIELRQEFEAVKAQVFTLECHDIYPCRVMVGKELDPKSWFSKTSFKEAYTQQIWWPHLADRAGAVGAEYGVQPMTFAVHDEYINRPSVVIVDAEGIVRFAYYGTFWGDRPSIHQLLEMLRSGNYSFAAPKRLKFSTGQ